MSKSSCAAVERIENAALRMTRVNCTEIKKNRLQPLTGNFVRKAAACFSFSWTQKRRKKTALRLVLFRRVIHDNRMLAERAFYCSFLSQFFAS